MRRVQRTRDAHILHRFIEALLRQGIHQIQIEIADAGGAQLLHRAMRVVRGVYTAEQLERARRKRLRTQGHSIDARLRIFRKPAALDGAGVRLQGDFNVRRNLDPLPQCT